MKNILDLIQIILEYGISGAVIFALLLMFILRLSRKVWHLFCWVFRQMLSFLPRPTIWNGTVLSLFSTVTYIFASDISNLAQFVETYYVQPAYHIEYDSSEVIRAYERKMSRHLFTDEFNQVRDSVRSMEREFNLSPGSIYECAYPECGLNPFVIRSDGRAAGFIQFTPAGLKNLGVSLQQVKKWCEDREAGKIMHLTRLYLRRCGLNGGDGADVYCAVFAPGYLKAPESAVLYEGKNNPAYYLNSQIDGYTDNGNRIYRDPFSVDFRITKKELRLWMERKKIEILNNG